MTYSLVVFDWDGTLMDSTPAIVAAIQGACRDMDLPVPPDEAASWVIGLGLADALRAAVPELKPEQWKAFSERYRYHYLTRDPELRLFDGIEALLSAVAATGASLAVATGKSRQGLDRSLDATGLRPRFDATRCADETHSKPHPAMLLELMDELMVPPERTLMIGDTSHDLNMARSAGVHGLGVTYGAHPITELQACSPAGIVHNVTELSDWLLPRVRSLAD
ncbi:HAD-IA family hydrolase [Achromobacter sp. GG226]|uniref:HAD-IA family hydrolase n=1 Tax=Verticiella alkaliphila TaxID=2779529 RepID=UPI001C0B91BD|nr:HAD-IA family hydrolase [Verticiella sp. GG226]MBU4612925.1 HAD-IA family hydrolase [Verticiella sp. GG226]